MIRRTEQSHGGEHGDGRAEVIGYGGVPRVEQWPGVWESILRCGGRFSGLVDWPPVAGTAVLEGSSVNTKPNNPLVEQVR